jgi:hypothetical protein
MPELESITLLEQSNGKRRMVRFYAPSACIVSDYRKNPGEFAQIVFPIAADLYIFKLFPQKVI